MLQTLREKPAVRKFVLWLVVAAMVLGIGIGVTAVLGDLLGTGRGGSGTASGPWAMRIGTETITPLAFQSELRVLSRQFDQQGLGQMPNIQARIRMEAMQRLVRRSLELQQARKAGLQVTDRELSDRIVTMPQLQQNGRFIGASEYKRLLARNEMNVVGFENDIRNDILVEKWEALMTAGAVVTDDEVARELARRNEKVRFDYVLVDPVKFAPTATIPETEVAAYYESHADRYKRSAARQARYVLFHLKDSEITAPSEDELRKAYESDRTKYTGSFEDSRDAISRQLAFSRTLDESKRRAGEFRAKVTDAASFDKLASDMGLKIEDSGPIQRNMEGISKLGPEFHAALFRATPGSVDGPAMTLRGSAVFVSSGDLPTGRASLEEARRDVLADLNKDKGLQSALVAARRAVASAAGDLAAVGKTLGVEVQNGPSVSKGEPVPSLGYDPAIERAAFAAGEGQIAEPVATAAGSVVVLKVAEKKTPSAAELASSRDAIRAELRRSREQALLDSILDTTLKRTEFKTNEEYFRQFGS